MGLQRKIKKAAKEEIRENNVDPENAIKQVQAATEAVERNAEEWQSFEERNPEIAQWVDNE